eukprot:comp7790_c0_seq1/m.3409 comp7790_c0_seq1/g.3409  ORF comp7790_c0_seq1/g.3409 comp7790_c0_seq1/m.3409 type:complete len:184 (-) comp7790_c0_seq1:253-804(-)
MGKKDSIGLRMQKNVLGKMGAKSVKSVIDDEMAEALDNLHDLVALQTDQKTADKLIKNVVKIVVKMGILLKNKQFTEAEIAQVGKSQGQFRKLSMSLVSFYEVIGSFDYDYLAGQLKDLQGVLKTLLTPHLTEKSIGRLDMIFAHFLKPGVMAKSFDPKTTEEHKILGEICRVLKKLVDENKI